MKALLVEALDKDALTGELVGLLDQIVRGVVARFGKGLDADDAAQECWLLVLSLWRKLDPDSRPFQFVTQICKHRCFEMRRVAGLRWHEALDPDYESTWRDYHEGRPSHVPKKKVRDKVARATAGWQIL